MRTFVAPFDPLIVRGALCASATAADRRSTFARASRTSPASRVSRQAGAGDAGRGGARADAPAVLEDIMSAFYDGRYDVLLSTTIVDSGLGIPTANT